MTEKQNFTEQLISTAADVNQLAADVLADYKDIPPRLKEAIDYTLTTGGKRIRAVLVLWTCRAVSGEINDCARKAAVAVEMLHSYSLVHDDLPAMDDDDFRRGKPSCHKAFNEATAILTGDALLTMSFEVLSKVEPVQTAAKLTGALASAGGPEGMIGGQMADMLAENSGGDIEQLKFIHTNKTAKLIVAAAVMGAIAACADEKQLEAISEYGLKLGLAFQVADDLLDVSGTSDELGKTAGKDMKQGKLTYPALLGVDKSKEIAEQLANEAVEALGIFDSKADMLRRLAAALLERKK